MANEPLQEQLSLLYQLQERDQELLSVQQKLQEIPSSIEQLEADVVRYEDDMAAKSAELAETEKEQRSKDAELEMNAVHREKYRDEQRVVTSNEAYTALERQIEYLDEVDGEAEDTILILMEKSDQLKEELAALEVAVNREKQKTASETAKLKQELKDLEVEKDEKLKQRKAFLPKIDKRLRDEYHRWMKAQFANRSGAARAKTGFVALSKNGICTSCRITIQQQTLKEAQKYEKQVYCSSCKRLLYVEPATPAESRSTKLSVSTPNTVADRNNRNFQIEQICQERRITELCHFTRIENLQSILQEKLLGRSLLEGRGQQFFFNDSNRFDGHKEAICLSISFPNYQMFYSIRELEKGNQEIGDSQWIVLLLDAKVLWKLDCAFCQRNAAHSSVRSISLEDRRKPEALKGMFGDFYNIRHQDLSIPQDYPTHPQAEVLVFDPIPVQYIKAIHFWDADSQERWLPSNIGTDYETSCTDRRYFYPRQDYEVWSPDKFNSDGVPLS